jgi:hypothetical protein
MSSKIKMDRFYRNTLDDYSGQNYLDEFDKVINLNSFDFIGLIFKNNLILSLIQFFQLIA